MKKKVNDLKSDYKKLLEKLSLIKKEFNEVRDKRYKKFREFFDAVSGEIDQIFKVRVCLYKYILKIKYNKSLNIINLFSCYIKITLHKQTLF